MAYTSSLDGRCWESHAEVYRQQGSVPTRLRQPASSSGVLQQHAGAPGPVLHSPFTEVGAASSLLDRLAGPLPTGHIQVQCCNYCSSA